MRVVPDGGTDIAWDGRTITVARLVAGPLRVALDDADERLGLRLRPGWAAAVLGVPLAELPPLVDLAEIWNPATVHRIHQRLAAAPTGAARRALLADLVAHRLARHDRLDGRVLTAAEHLARPATSVPAVADSVGLSVRQLRRRFDHHVGLGPKTLQIVLRFQRFLRWSATDPRPRPTPARAAAECGYADQSHLARDCQRLAGATPSTLIAQRPPGTSAVDD